MTPEEKYELMMAVLKEMQVIRMFGAFEIRYDAELDRVFLIYQHQLMGSIAEQDLRVMANSFSDVDVAVMRDSLRARKALLN